MAVVYIGGNVADTYGGIWLYCIWGTSDWHLEVYGYTVYEGVSALYGGGVIDTYIGIWMYGYTIYRGMWLHCKWGICDWRF